MSESIRIISSSAHCDTVQVYDHQVIVRRVPGRFNCECNLVTDIGNVPCTSSTPHGCWHIVGAIEFLSKAKGMTLEWFDSEDEAYWSWATRLLVTRWKVQSPNGVAWVVASEAERVVTLVIQ